MSLAFSIPLLLPFILAIGTPELLAICLLGLTLVVSLSHSALMKGLVATTLGLLLSTIGDEPQTGELRWTFDLIYLWDGMPLVPLALGLCVCACAAVSDRSSGAPCHASRIPPAQVTDQSHARARMERRHTKRTRVDTGRTPDAVILPHKHGVRRLVSV